MQYGPSTSGDVTPYPPRSLARRKCTWALTRWLLVDKRPFHLVESKAFQQFCKSLNPRFEVPGRMGVRNLATRIYEITESAVKQHLKSLWHWYPCYTADMWSAMDGS